MDRKDFGKGAGIGGAVAVIIAIICQLYLVLLFP